MFMQIISKPAEGFRIACCRMRRLQLLHQVVESRNALEKLKLLSRSKRTLHNYYKYKYRDQIYIT